MKGWSKAVGAGLGYIVGGPIGAVLGYIAGQKLSPKFKPVEGHLLIANLLGFTASLLKTSGSPSPEHRLETIGFVSKLFHFDADDESLAGQLLDRLLTVDLDIEAMAQTFNQHSDIHMRVRLLEILCTVCLLLHGALRGSQLAVLTRIAQTLELDQKQWQVIETRHRGPSPELDIDCCFALLDLYPEATEEEVRAAYRKLAKKYHPDRSAHLNHATQKGHVERMTLTNVAYETIRAGKGF
jgi:DnaJ like chaperone protein